MGEAGGATFGVADLEQMARESTGLDDFGSDPLYREGLAEAIASLDEDAVPPFASAVLKVRLVAQLEARLRVVADMKQHPEIGAREVERPVFIVGLPRSGTTVTFDMLAADPAFRFPREWEWMLPWPATQAATIDTDPRIDLIQPMMRRFAEAAPELAAVQRLDCTLPGECNTGLMFNFTSTNIHAEFNTVRHLRWIVEGHTTGLYRDHRRLLQYMQWQGPKGRWLLKSPQHMFDLQGLMETYPDARIVWTHRDPVSTFSSLSSMIVLLQRAVDLSPDPHQVGEMVAYAWSRAILNALRAREENPAIAAATIDVAHGRIVSEPISVMRDIYAHVDQPFTAETEARLRAFSNGETAQRLGRHRHAPEMFGIDTATVRSTLAIYYETFGEFLHLPRNEPKSSPATGRRAAR